MSTNALPALNTLTETQLAHVRDEGWLRIADATYVATDEDVAAVDEELNRRELDRENRQAAQDHARWKGAHNRRLRNGGY